MADGMTDCFHAHKDSTTHDILSHKHAFHVRACEKTVVFVMHAAGVYSVYTSPCCVPAIRNCVLKKKKSLTALRQALKNATTVCGRFLCCSLYNFHPVFRSTTKSKSSLPSNC